MHPGVTLRGDVMEELDLSANQIELTRMQSGDEIRAQVTQRLHPSLPVS